MPAPEANPIGGLVRHIGGASHRLWLRGTGQEVPEEMAPTGQSPEAVLLEFAQNLEKVKAGLRTLTEGDLYRVVRVGSYQAKAVFVLDHIAAHAQHHAGQIITTRKLWNARRGLTRAESPWSIDHRLSTIDHRPLLTIGHGLLTKARGVWPGRGMGAA